MSFACRRGGEAGHVNHPWLVGVCVCVCDVRVMRGVLRHSISGVPARWRRTRAKSARAPRKVKQRTHSPSVLGLTDRPAHLLDRG